MRIYIPTINDTVKDFQALFSLQQLIDQSLNVEFDFSHCSSLKPHAIALIGGLARSVEKRGGTVHFEWKTCENRVLHHLIRNEFVRAFGSDIQTQAYDSIPYREHTLKDKASIMEYLKKYWLGRGWVGVSPLLKSKILGNVWEIYENAFGHSHSPIGVISCGQYYRSSGKLQLAVTDLGMGIAQNVQNYFSAQIARILGGPILGNYSSIDDEGALEWAFTEGMSTRQGAAAGLGLKLLKEFIRVNGGQLQVFSNHAYVEIDKNGEQYHRQEESIKGTIVNISLQCDNRYYCLAVEKL